jgi:UDP-N-acetylglucosamine 2-epimerase (non-hydrolysing)
MPGGKSLKLPRLAFVVGTRPEIIKLNSLIRVSLAEGLHVELLHTGQHYDYRMSEIFFKELDLPDPSTFLEVGSGDHGAQTGEAVARVEGVLKSSRPDLVIVVGDTNSTVAGLLAGIKLHIPVAHVEAGVRSFDWMMPEEINRRLVDSVSTVCFAPTRRALYNLGVEGRASDSFLVGDTLVETCLPMAEKALGLSGIIRQLNVVPGEFGLLTLHRSENVDSEERLQTLVDTLEALNEPLLYPIHPRARKMFERFGLLERLERSARVLPPLGYIDFLRLIMASRFIVTDSGGVQQEASILGRPCLTLRNNTEWIETLESGDNRLLAMNKPDILAAVASTPKSICQRETLLNEASPFRPGAASKMLGLIRQAWDNGALRMPQSNFLENGVPGIPATFNQEPS